VIPSSRQSTGNQQWQQQASPCATAVSHSFGSKRMDEIFKTGILIYIQQDATLHSLFYLEIALHVSGNTTTHHQERKQLYLQHLVFIRSLLLPAATVVPPETCRAVSR
jgi:hypothetical protein